MEDIFVVKRCNKIIIQGRRTGETSHLVPAANWYRITDTRTGGFIGDGYDHEEEAKRECQRLNAVSKRVSSR
jgi:hypothetical protein